MADPGPSVDFVADAADVPALKALIRQEAPDVLIGTKDLPDGTTFVTVTVFSRSPQALAAIAAAVERFADRSELSGERPAETTLGDLVERVRQARQSD